MNTENFIEITSTYPDENILREYDRIIGLTLLNIYGISKDKKAIRLLGFDRQNKEHWYVLHVALLAREIYQKEIEIEGSFWDVFLINRKIKKQFNKVKRAPFFAVSGIWVNELLEFLRPLAEQNIKAYFSFEDIYKTYYDWSE